jgi:predicted DNA-binding transcriptional regulator AlpA
MPDELVGLAEIAAMLGVSRQRADKILRTDEDFPEPQAILTAGRIWSREAVEEWARATGREIRETRNDL